MRRRWMVLGLVAVAASMAVACTDSTSIAGQDFDPRTPGRLTVATSLPAPGFWDGADVGSSPAASRTASPGPSPIASTWSCEVIDVPFERLVAGDLGGADMALAQITITPAREDVLDFSDPTTWTMPAPCSAPGEELTDLKTAKEQRWAVQRGPSRPTCSPTSCDRTPTRARRRPGRRGRRRRRRARSTPRWSTCPPRSCSRRDAPEVTTGGRFAIDGDMAVALPSGSANVEVVDAALRALDADRTLHDLRQRYLDPAFAKDPAAVPVIRTPDQ